MKNSNSFFVILLIVTAILSCKEDEKCKTIPYEYVNFYIDINDPEFIELNSVGNSIAITGGFKGIIVYRKTIDEFSVFERACPHDPEAQYGRVKISEQFYAIDSVCGSKFSLTFDGSPIEGPARCGLKKYNSNFNPQTNRLYINNEF